MSEITGLKAAKTREKRVNVFLDGKLALRRLAEVALKEGLKVGQELTESQMEALAGLDRYQRCHNAAIRYLAYRPRSEAEIRERLQRRGYDSACLEITLARLKEQGLVDDTAFARFWKDNRPGFSRRRLGEYLGRRGFSYSIISETTARVWQEHGNNTGKSMA